LSILILIKKYTNIFIPHKAGFPKGSNPLWSFFWKGWRFGGGKTVLSKKMVFPPPKKEKNDF